MSAVSSIPTTTTEACVAHRSHAPEPDYCELHHIVVQAWQAFWQPPKPWPNGGPSPDHAGLTLWDARKVPLCRTGHGNLHFLLVRAMHAYLDAPGDDGSDERIAAAWQTVKRQAASDGLTVGRAEEAFARQAMIRWRDAGGSLLALCEARLWGEI